MNPGEMKQLIRDHYEATTHLGDEEAIEAQVAAGFVDHDAAPDIPPGPEGVKQHIRRIRQAFPDLRVEIEDMVAEGDRVAVRAVWRGTHSGPFLGLAATGRRVEFSGMVFWRIADGRIAERWANLDRATLLRQLTAE